MTAKKSVPSHCLRRLPNYSNRIGKSIALWPSHAANGTSLKSEMFIRTSFIIAWQASQKTEYLISNLEHPPPAAPPHR